MKKERASVRPVFIDYNALIILELFFRQMEKMSQKKHCV